MNYKTDKDVFKFKKPEYWVELPLYKKISYYKRVLDANYSPYVDKLTAKKIVKELIGDELEVAKIIRILKGPYDLQETDLNCDHMIKASHGSGWNINIEPSTTVERCKWLLQGWNRYYDELNEKQYKFIEPQFFIEEKIDDKFHGKNGNADVYTFRCIHGDVVSINVKRFSEFNKYDVDFKPLEPPKFELEKPAELEKMIMFSKKLCAPFEFVRIDFHIDKNSKIYFSEFTFTPNAGSQFYSDDVERNLGALWI